MFKVDPHFGLELLDYEDITHTWLPHGVIMNSLTLTLSPYIILKAPLSAAAAIRRYAVNQPLLELKPQSPTETLIMMCVPPHLCQCEGCPACIAMQLKHGRFRGVRPHNGRADDNQ